MAKYAQGTTVPVERSRDELAQLLRRYGIKRYVQEHDEDNSRHAVAFQLNDRWYRIGLEPPPLEEFETYTDRYGWETRREKADAIKERDKEFRRRWRVLLLLMKAKLETVQDGTMSAEDEFLPYLALADGSTFSQSVQGQVEEYYTTGKLPKLLPG